MLGSLLMNFSDKVDTCPAWVQPEEPADTAGTKPQHCAIP